MFFEGAIREAGVLHGGFTKNTLDKAWAKYVYIRPKDYLLWTSLTQRFKTWVDDPDFSAATESDPGKKQAVLHNQAQKKIPLNFVRLKALNAVLGHVMKGHGRP